MWTLQIIEYYEYESNAEEALENLTAHPGYLGGTTGERPGGAGYYIQAFFRTDQKFSGPGSDRMDSLPDGAKLVFVPALLQEWYGFTEAT